MTKITDLARGKWPDILASLACISSTQLADKHQPCPLCGGKNRYRFDDIDGTGSWFCNQCGGRDGSGGGGSGMDLLIRKTGWDFAEASDRVRQYLAVMPSSDPPTQGAENVYHYSDTFIVCRFPGKRIRPLWYDGSQWVWKVPPGKRPIYRQADLAAKPNAPVLICEGEKAVDAAAALFPSIACVGWSSGCKSYDKTDWSPIQGRRCILWPDADDVGTEAMESLAQVLLAAGASEVSIVNPPDDVPKGWDLADSDCPPEQLAAHIKANSSLVTPAQPELSSPPPTAAEHEPEPIKPLEGGYFTCLGFDADSYYYQPHSTGQVVRLSRSAHTSTNLVALAPLSYWETFAPNGKGTVDWTNAAATLFAISASRGVYEPNRIRGRGAWWDNKRTVLHLGNRLIIDGEPQPMLNSFETSYLYQRMSELKGPGDSKPLSDLEALTICELAERFRWEVPASGLLLAGWVTLAPICGALDWRPHIWLTGGSGSGKSAILDQYVGQLLGDMGLQIAGNTSEAGIRQTLRADALPVVFDEAESNERSDQVRIQNILALARVASSESQASLLKGSPGGDVTRFNIRSMFMMSSISTALKQGADRSRFAQLVLRPPSDTPIKERAEHWEKLEKDLGKHINEEVAMRLIARTVSLVPVIRKSIRVFNKVAADHFDSQRLGDQYGTLLAGAWSLMSSDPVTKEQAQALIAQNDWEPYSQATEVPDEQRCIQRILQHQVRVETDEKNCTRTLGELVEIVAQHAMDMDVSSRAAQETLGRHGLRVSTEEGLLYVSNTAEALAAILRDTAWSNSWPTVLARLPGAARAGVVRFRGAGAVSRASALRLEAL